MRPDRSSSTRSSGRWTTRPAIAGRIRPVTRPLPVRGLSRPARRHRAAPGAARRGRPPPGHGRGRGRRDARRRCSARFPEIAGAETLPDELLDLHTAASWSVSGRSSSGSRATCGRRRSWPPSASRSSTRSCRPAGSATGPGRRRPSASRPATSGRRPARSSASATRGSPSRTRSGRVRGFIQRLDAGAHGPIQARLGEDLRSLGEGAATAFVGLTGPTGFVGLRDDPNAYGRTAPTPRIRLVLGQPPMRPNLERLAVAYHATSWVLGREAAALLPLDGLAGASLRGPWAARRPRWRRPSRRSSPRSPATAGSSGSSTAVRRRLVATALGGAAAGYRLLGARLADPDDDAPAVVELLPPGGRLPPGARTRANVGLEPLPGGAGDPDVVPARGLFAPPERVRRPAVLGGRGGPGRDRGRGRDAPRPRRAGPLRAAARRDPRRARPGRPAPAVRDGDAAAGEPGERRRAATRARRPAGTGRRPPRPSPRRRSPIPRRRTRTARRRPESGAATPAPRTRRGAADRDAPTDAVERLLALIRDELGRPTQRRLAEIEPGRWWLADADDLAAAATPLADRVEWAVYSLLSTAGPISETAFFERMATMFTATTSPTTALVRAASRATAAWPARPTGSSPATTCCAGARSTPTCSRRSPTAAGASGCAVWIGRREQTRRLATGGLLGDLLEPGEERLSLGGIGAGRGRRRRGRCDLVRPRQGRLPVRGRMDRDARRDRCCAGTPGSRRRGPRPVPGHRAGTGRARPLQARSLAAAAGRPRAGTWHIVKSDQLRAFLARDPLDLADLEPYLGLEPTAARRAEQMPLF